MKLSGNISEKWIKASVLGALWASSEIVLGSFIHNLRIPLGSNLLTGIAIILMISTSYIWRERGLFWRAGVICALMKTISPSAVIFGPMVAIFSQSVMLELSVRLLGRTVGGFIAGAILAMSWNLFQKIANYIIFYGFNIVEVYSELLRMAQKQLGLDFEIVWLPVVFLLLLYWIMGIIFGIVGIRTGRSLMKERVALSPPEHYKQTNLFEGNNLHQFPYSIAWLFASFFAMITLLLLFDRSEWYVWMSAVTITALTWIIRYRRAMRQLRRPRFWVSFVIITMITAWVFNRMQSLDIINGIMIGVRMNFRAATMILGFTVLGTELYNPIIRDYFLRSSFRQLPMALELSFKSLPVMIAAMPEVREIRKAPVTVIRRVVSLIEHRLKEVKAELPGRVTILTGPVGSGKSSRTEEEVRILKKQGVEVGGIITRRIVENERTVGYDIFDIVEEKITPFLREGDIPGCERVGRYSILPEGLKAGREALKRAYERGDEVIVVDEIGRLELSGGGWAEIIPKLIAQDKGRLIITVRDTLREEVVKKWSITE